MTPKCEECKFQRDDKCLLTTGCHFAPKDAPSDGSTASYYELPKGATELQDLISARDMNAQMGEIFRACYRYGRVAHSPRERDLRKIIFYAKAELSRLEKYGLEV